MKKLIFLCIVLFSVCCNSYEGPEKGPEDAVYVPHIDLLARNKWKLESFTQEPAYNGVTDVYAILDDCSKDNVFIFKKDGSYAIDAGFKKCADSEPQTIATGTWEFGKDDRGIVDEFRLNIKAGGNRAVYTIDVITDSRLRLIEYMDQGGTRYAIRRTFRNVK